MSRLRCATEADLVTVAGWIDSAEAARLWAGHRVGWPVDLGALPAAIEWSTCESFCLDAERGVIAFGQLVPKPADRLHVARLIVDPGRRGEGIGRTLFSQIVDVALARSPHALSLNVIPENDRAIRLYEKQGFVPAARPPAEPESTSLYMEFPLPGARPRSA